MSNEEARSPLFGEKLKQFRQSMNVTQQQIAEELQVPRSVYKRWETYGHVPDPDMLSRLAKVYGTTVAYLTGETDDPRPRH